MSLPAPTMCASSPAEVPVRVVIVDDSVVARAALARMIAEDGAFAVVAAFDGAQRAIEWLRYNAADVIMLDIQMPGVDGLTALPELLAAGKGARVLIVSTLAEHGARASLEALALGAADTLAKPATNGLGGQFGAVLLDRLRQLGHQVEAVSQAGTVAACRQVVSRGPVGCLGIGASTGGVFAIGTFFSALPRSFTAPILITQHLPPPFTRFFAEQVAKMSQRITAVAEEGMPIEAGNVYVAPGIAHLECRAGSGSVPRIALTSHPVRSRCLPSVDPMLESMARCYGPAAMAVILTGMGRDGAIGSEAVVAAHGTVIVQDQESSAVWGMPGAVARSGHAALVGRPEALAECVAQCGHLQ